MININISRKHILFLVFIIAIATVINYTIAQGGVQSHPASEVAAGSFAAGTYTFTKLVSAEVCIPDDGSCETAWPSGGTTTFDIVTVAGPPANNCATLCGNAGKSGCAFGIERHIDFVDTTWAAKEGVYDIVSCSTIVGGPGRCACYP